MSLPADLQGRLRLPLIAAPMLKVSGPDLVVAACRAGVLGAFPTANAGDEATLDQWLGRIQDSLSADDAPCVPNIIIHRAPQKLAADVAAIRRHGVQWAITSVGSPAPVVEPLHAAGCRVLADVGSLAHARKAAAAGADGLVLLSAGAGGQTGWLNGLAFVRAVREWFDGPVVLAGGISDGHALWAARAAGADLAYMGTRCIALRESMADEDYRSLLLQCDADDVQLTRAFTGLPTNMLRPSIEAAGLDPAALDESVTPAQAQALFGAARATFDQPGEAPPAGPKRWRDIRSAGHTVGAVREPMDMQALVQATRAEYAQAMARSLEEAAADPFGLR